MGYTYVYDPRAIMEYEEAMLWYNEKSTTASKNFEFAVNEKLQQICLDPKLYRNTKKQFREAHLKKYPFSIIYFIDEEKRIIVIVSVFHSSRNPVKKFIA